MCWDAEILAGAPLPHLRSTLLYRPAASGTPPLHTGRTSQGSMPSCSLKGSLRLCGTPRELASSRCHCAAETAQSAGAACERGSGTAKFIILNAKFIILNTNIIILNTNFIIVNTDFIILNATFIIFTHLRVQLCRGRGVALSIVIQSSSI